VVPTNHNENKWLFSRNPPLSCCSASYCHSSVSLPLIYWRRLLYVTEQSFSKCAHFMTPTFIYTVLNQMFNFNTHLEVFVLFQTSCEQTRCLYWECTAVLMTALWSRNDKQFRFNSKLCGQYAQVCHVPSRDTVLYCQTVQWGGKELAQGRSSSF